MAQLNDWQVTSQKSFPFEENVSNKCSQLLRCKPSERTLKALSVTCVNMSSYVSFFYLNTSLSLVMGLL